VIREQHKSAASQFGSFATASSYIYLIDYTPTQMCDALMKKGN